MKNIKVFILCFSIFTVFIYGINCRTADKCFISQHSELKHYYVENNDILAGKLEEEFVSDDTSTSNTPKPRKDVYKYYHLSEDKLIQEVYDSLQTDYDYYNRGYKNTPGQVKAMLTTITYQNNYLKLLDTLLEHGFAKPFISENDDFNILLMTYNAACDDKIDYLNVLIKHGADLTVVQDLDGATLLHAAARNGNIDLAKKVLEAGVPVNIEDKRSKTPLYFAVENNEFEMVKFLVDKGARIKEDYIEISNDRDIIAFIESKTNLNTFSKPIYNNPAEDKEWEEAYKCIEEGDLDALIKIENSGKDLSKMFYKGEPAPCTAVAGLCR